VSPLLVDFAGSAEELFQCVEAELLTRRLAAVGDSVVVLGGMPLAAGGATNFLRILRVGDGR